MKKPVYIRCPRCELNYIQKKEKFCSVCKAEMTAKDEFGDGLDLELCPICRTNYIQADEIMCDSCLKDHQTEDGEINTDWEEYLSREDDEDIMSVDEQRHGMEVTDLTDSGLMDDDLPPDIDFGDEGDVFDDDDDDDEDDDDDDLDDDDDDDDDFDDDDDLD